MFLFNRREVYNGSSIKESARIRDILSANGILYRIEVKSHSGEWTGRGVVRSYTGSAGTNIEQDRQTIIYVKKADYDKAMNLIHSAR